METNADYRNWDDLVFENRNKEYGAYVLRRSYDDKVLLAMFISVSLAAFLFLIPNERRNVSVEPIFKKDHVLVLDREVVIEPRVPEKRSAPPSKPKSKKKADTPPLVTKEPVQQVAIETASVTVNSDQSAETFTQGVETTTPDVGVMPPETKTSSAFVMNPEVAPRYAGGHAGIGKYLRKKLRYPASARRTGAEGTVFVSFIVRGDGTVYDVEVIRGFHPDCDKEAVRVISQMPGWTGGAHGGMPVSVKMVLPIKFSLQ